MIEGRFCPEVEHAPETAEGHIVAATLDRWGIWRRAGMSGSIVGIDTEEAMRELPPQCDRAFALRLLVAAEAPFCAAAARMNDGNVKGE
jgi:hypothetical protein